MKKLIFFVMIALMGISQQVKAADIVNNTNCDVYVNIVFYSPFTCNITGSCSSFPFLPIVPLPYRPAFLLQLTL
jgi:hypothetical protein